MLKRKTSKLAMLVLITALTVTSFAGCGSKNASPSKEEAKVPQVVTYNLAADPRSIDPSLNTAVDGSTVLVNCFEGLYRLDEKENPVPGVAEKCDVSADGLKYTFHLRKDAKWSDGQPVKAADFEYSWKRILNPDTASEYSNMLYYIKNGEAYNSKQAKAEDVGVKAIDDYTLEATLDHPITFFLQLVAHATYYPERKDVIEKDPKQWTLKGETYVCNGPFKMKEWKSKDTITLVKNDNYWNAKEVKLDTVNFKMLEQATSALAGFKTGQIDMLDSLPPQEIPQLLKDGTGKIIPELSANYLVFNVTNKAASVDPKAAKAISDPRVRRALSLAINRKEIVENVLKAGQAPAAALVPPSVPESKGKDFRQKDYFKVEGDVEQAKKLLAEAGYPDGKGFPKITYMYNTNESNQNTAVAIQDMWKKNLGIESEMQAQEWKVFQKTRVDKQYILARAGWVGDYIDATTFLDLFHSKNINNEPGYNSPEYDKKIEASRKEADPAKSIQYLHEAEDILMNDMPIIPLTYGSRVVCIKPNVKGIHKSMLGFVDFSRAYVEKK